jgi:preprotein translocase subunit SecE
MSEQTDSPVESNKGGGRADDARTSSFFSNPREFVRETISELRRVVWPTRKQVVTYTIVVLVFVVVMSLFVSAIDLLVGRGVLRIFGA